MTCKPRFVKGERTRRTLPKSSRRSVSAICTQRQWGYLDGKAAQRDGCRMTASCGYRLIEQRQVDGVAHLAITEIARVQPVAAIVQRQHLGQTLGVA